jgi:hypothetical protein
VASSRIPGPVGLDGPYGEMCPAQTPGPLGLNDQADPNVFSFLGDTPGPLGINDYADPDLRWAIKWPIGARSSLALADHMWQQTLELALEEHMSRQERNTHPGTDTKASHAHRQSNDSRESSFSLGNTLDLYRGLDSDAANGTASPIRWPRHVRWAQAGSSLLGIIGNGLGVVVGSVLVVTPEVTMVTKVIGGLVLAKSVVGWGLNWYNLTQALKEESPAWDAPSSAFRGVAVLATPGSTDAILLADALDLGIDLASGRGYRYAYGAPKLLGSKGFVRRFDPVEKFFAVPYPVFVNAFQGAQVVQVTYEDLIVGP